MEITAEQKALLETQFPEEIEKIAEAQLASDEALETLRAYGASLAEEMLMANVEDGEELQKTASENKVAVSEQVENALNALGAQSYDEECELSEEELTETMHKEAQAAAWAIAEGFFGEIANALEQNPELVKEAMMVDESELEKEAGAKIKPGSAADFKNIMKKVKPAGKDGQGAFKKSVSGKKPAPKYSNAGSSGKKSSKKPKSEEGADLNKVYENLKAHGKKYAPAYTGLGGLGVGAAAGRASKD